MADISTVFGILLTLGIVFPGLLTAWRLLFPAAVERAQLRLELTPWRCFWLGGVLVALLIVPIVVLLAVPIGPVKLAGWVLIFISLSLASLGAAGLAGRMSAEIRRASPGLSLLGAYVRAAVVLELAAAFPVIGWFVAIPLLTVTSLGATVFALLHSVPAPAAIPVAPVVGSPAAGLPQS
jgi:hypothetical protein